MLELELEVTKASLKMGSSLGEEEMNDTQAEGFNFGNFLVKGSGSGRRFLGDPDGIEKEGGLWGFLASWFGKCTWSPCRAARIVWRVGQTVLELYTIVCDS